MLGWPPPKVLTTVFSTPVYSTIDLTRLGTDDGAADFEGLGLPKDQRSLKNLDLRSK